MYYTFIQLLLLSFYKIQTIYILKYYIIFSHIRIIVSIRIYILVLNYTNYYYYVLYILKYIYKGEDKPVESMC